jgi:hypothetical protein
MAQLLFFDTNHEYTVDGEKLPSVSHILRFMSREIYEDLNQYTLDRAATRGTDVHAYCEELDKYGNAECKDEYVPYVQAYIKFRREHCVEWADIEARYYHPERRYAGTIDRRGTVDGKTALLDIKTLSSIHKPIVKAQLNGYASMLVSNGLPEVEKLYCLQLMKDGKYRLYETAKDMTEFNACYDLHTALSKKHGRGIIE